MRNLSKKRTYTKRFDLNEYENNLLSIKAGQCGLKEAQLIRELITGFAPVEKPGKEFYEAMNQINKIGVNINQIAAVANGTGVIEEAWLRALAEKLEDHINELKKICLDARPYPLTYYEKLIDEQKKAKEEGTDVPQFGDNLFKE